MCSPEEQIQPHTESSTEAMDTDEGQRTTARLLEEARHLLESTMEPTYAIIDEPMSVMTGGSEAVISDILATQGPRELTLSEVGERRPAPSEMRAGLPTGSFSPFDFDKEFQARHGVRPEDADKLGTVTIHQGNHPSWQSPLAKKQNYNLQKSLLLHHLQGVWK